MSRIATKPIEFSAPNNVAAGSADADPLNLVGLVSTSKAIPTRDPQRKPTPLSFTQMEKIRRKARIGIQTAIAIMSAFCLCNCGKPREPIELPYFPKTYSSPCAPRAVLNNPHPDLDDFFGQSVAISDNTLVVGAPGDDEGEQDTGSAYIYDSRGGSLLHSIHNPKPARSFSFGRSVAIDAGKLVVGAPGMRDGLEKTTTAYLFDAATGNLMRAFTDPNPVVDSQFGWDVAISGDLLVVGAPGAEAAYVFDGGTGALLHTLHNPSTTPNESFGQSLAILGGLILIGAPKADAGAQEAGRAYLFDAATGALVRTFDDKTPGIKNHFGSSVALGWRMPGLGSSGSKLVLVGAPGTLLPTTNTDPGRALLFDAASGALLTTFQNPNPSKEQIPKEMIGEDLFGSAVAISGTSILVGAPLNLSLEGRTGRKATGGSAYLFDASTGSLTRTYESERDLVGGYYFGSAVAVEANDALIGSRSSPVGLRSSGIAYYYNCAEPVPPRVANPRDGKDDPPAAPKIIEFSEGPAHSSIVVKWLPSSYYAVSYEIEWFSSASLTPETLVGKAGVNKDTTEFATGSLRSGEKYWFHVRALSAAQAGAWSAAEPRVAGP